MAMIFVYEHRIGDFRCIGDKELPAGLEGRAFQHVRDGIAWTDSRVLSAYEALGDALGPVDVECCFLPPGKGQSPHYAGLALDMGRRLTEEKRKRLWAFCLKSPMFSYVEPPYWTPNWVHGEVAASAASIPGRGYPYLAPGDAGPHVFLLQELLTRRGFPCLLCGHFNQDTRRALMAYQSHFGLPVHGHADGQLWQHMTQ